MRYLIKVLWGYLASFAMAMILMPLVIKGVKKLKAEQTILSYVEKHASKNGTPTMGGIGFILASTIVTVILCRDQSGIAIYATAVFFAYGFIGFLDDYIKVRYRQNQGLKAYQKVIAQVGVAVIVALYCFRNVNIGSAVNLPFSDRYTDMGYWYIPFCILVFLATTNSVNLTDGLDGLAGSTTLVYLTAMVIILSLSTLSGDNMTADEVGLAILAASVSGALLAFLWYNSTPAKCFMGDTGSMALGAVVCTIPLFVRRPFLILLMGGVFVLSSISVIIQVIYYKSRGKRVFLMAPFHHHLELKGLSESKIVSYYTIVTAALSAVGVLSVVWQMAK